MHLVVGLGNPGLEYELTRHNVGFRVLDELADRWDLSFTRQGSHYLEAAGEVAGDQLVLLKPLTYMNLSGRALRRWSAVTGCELGGTGTPDAMAPIVVCDDLSLPLGSLRIRRRGSSGGQKGLASIIEVVGEENFPRVRLGIAGAPGVIPTEDWSDYVLDEFEADEQPVARDLVLYAADAVAVLLAEGPEVAAARFNRIQSAESP